MALKRRNSPTLELPALLKANVVTTDTITSLIRRYIDYQQLYLMLFALVIEVVSNSALDYLFGKIRTKILYLQILREETVDMIPYLSANLVTIPVVGLIVICYRMPSPTIDVRLGVVLDLHYYVGVLNINNRLNNNIFQGVSIKHPDLEEDDPDNTLSGRLFYVDLGVLRSTYKLGDTILEGRLGQRVKFTHTVKDLYLLPKVVIVGNHRDGGSLLNPLNSGTYISLLLTDLYKLVIIILSDDEIKVKTKKVLITADQVLVKCGGSTITISDSGVLIDAPSGVNISGNVTLNNSIDGNPSAFCKLPSCLFTGAPHTAKEALN